jgi:uncharacterized damage-inducible protein DinB
MKNLILILVLCPILLLGQSNEANDIRGVWRVTAVSWNEDTKQFADCEMIKFITNTRWASLFYWPDTKKFAGTGGGTYKWENGVYLETAEYFTWDPSAVTGKHQAFKMSIQNGKLIQEGHLNTDKFKYPYYAVHERLDKSNWVYNGQNSPQGVWKLTQGIYGEESYNTEQINEKYGQVIKIITPKFFIGTFFDKSKKTVDGVTFGTYSFDKDGKYQETIRCWSWNDKSVTGKQPSFDWNQPSPETFHQKGYLNSDTYKNYLIDEHYKRLEPLGYKTKVWTVSDQELLLSELRRTKNEMVEATESLSDEQWHFKPDEKLWNIAQAVEHMGIYERLYLQEIRVALYDTDPKPEIASQILGDKTYLAWMAEKNPHTAPKHAVPPGFMKGKDNLDYFLYGRNLLEEIVSTTEKDLKTHFMPRKSEPLGLRSIHGLLVIHYGHTDRHLRQIERIKAHPDYPKGQLVKGK